MSFSHTGGWQFAPIFWTYPQHFVDSLFVAHHCFGMQAQQIGGRQETASRVHFAPTRSDLPEIAGTIWINRNSGSVERIQWSFIGLTGGDLGGGEVQFAEENPPGAAGPLLLPIYVDQWWSDGTIHYSTRGWITEWRMENDGSHP